MKSKNILTFYLTCDFNVSLAKKIDKIKIVDINLKNIFRYDLRENLNSSIDVIDLSDLVSLKSCSAKIFDEKYNDIELRITDAKIYLFNENSNSSIKYSVMVFKAYFYREGALTLNDFSNLFLKFNTYEQIYGNESKFSNKFEYKIEDEKFIFPTFNENNKSSKETSMFNFFIAEIVKFINSKYSPKLFDEKSDENNDRLIKNKFFLDYRWLTFYGIDDSTYINKEEHKIAKKIAYGNKTEYDNGEKVFTDERTFDFYSTGRGTFILGKGDYFASKFKLTYYQDLYLFAFYQRISIERNIIYLQNKNEQNLKELIKNENIIYEEITSKFTFQNPTSFDQYNEFFNIIQKSLDVKYYFEQLSYNREYIKSQINEIDNLNSSLKNKFFWHLGISGQVAIALTGTLSSILSLNTWLVVGINLSIVISSFLIGFLIYFFSNKKVRAYLVKFKEKKESEENKK